MFICCTAITICTKAENSIDPRLNRVLPNGTVVKKDNQFTQAVDELGSQNFFFCKGLDDEWFSDVRFGLSCAQIETPPEKSGFITKPRPFGSNQEQFYLFEEASREQLLEVGVSKYNFPWIEICFLSVTYVKIF
mgnify:CR=1 FL=1